MAIRWDSETDWKDNQDSSGTTGRNGNLRQSYKRDLPPLTNGLVGYWPLHDKSATDYSGNGNHGTLNGGIDTGVAGKAGLQAMSFDGSDDYISASIPTSEVKTISFWYRGTRVDNSRSYRMPLTDGSSGNNWIAFGEATSDISGETITVSIGKYVYTYTTETIEADIWHHIVIRWNGSHYDFIIDGEFIEGKNGGTHSNLWQTDSIDIGARSIENNGYLEGSLGGIRLYDRSLSDSEVQTLYEWGAGDYARPPNDGISYYKLDGDATDSWNGNDGTANGGLVYSSDSIRGQSADFDGSDDYINLGSDLAEASDLTVSAWIKLDSIPGNNYTEICTKRRVTAFSVNSNNGELHGNLGDGSSWGNGVNGSPLPVGEWVHVAAVYDSANEIRLYRNGVEDARGAESLSIGSNSEPRGIGAKYKDGTQWANFFDGKIDDLRIYGRTLNPREIFELYRYGTRGRDMRKFLVTQ